MHSHSTPDILWLINVRGVLFDSSLILSKALSVRNLSVICKFLAGIFHCCGHEIGQHDGGRSENTPRLTKAPLTNAQETVDLNPLISEICSSSLFLSEVSSLAHHNEGLPDIPTCTILRLFLVVILKFRQH